MAIKQCPECSKEVSDTAYKCPHCGFVINKPKRGVTGVIFKYLFLFFNGFMLIWLVFMLLIDVPAESAVMAKTIGSGVLFFI